MINFASRCNRRPGVGGHEVLTSQNVFGPSSSIPLPALGVGGYAGVYIHNANIYVGYGHEFPGMMSGPPLRGIPGTPFLGPPSQRFFSNPYGTPYPNQVPHTQRPRPPRNHRGSGKGEFRDDDEENPFANLGQRQSRSDRQVQTPVNNIMPRARVVRQKHVPPPPPQQQQGSPSQPGSPVPPSPLQQQQSDQRQQCQQRVPGQQQFLHNDLFQQQQMQMQQQVLQQHQHQAQLQLQQQRLQSPGNQRLQSPGRHPIDGATSLAAGAPLTPRPARGGGLVAFNSGATNPRSSRRGAANLRGRGTKGLTAGSAEAAFQAASELGRAAIAGDGAGGPTLPPRGC